MAHTLDERIARWLLMTQDAVARPDFPLRLEFVRLMVAVDIAKVQGAMNAFVRRERIRYDGEIVFVISRSGLRQDTCECYQAQLMAMAIEAPSIS